MDDDTPDPAFQRAFEPVLVKMGEDFDECLLEHIFCLRLVTGIPTANGHHFAGETPKEPVLASGVSLQAVFNQLFFGQCTPVKPWFYMNMIPKQGKMLPGEQPP